MFKGGDMLLAIGMGAWAGLLLGGWLSEDARKFYRNQMEAKEQCEVNLPRSQQCVPVWEIEENNNDQ